MALNTNQKSLLSVSQIMLTRAGILGLMLVLQSSATDWISGTVPGTGPSSPVGYFSNITFKIDSVPQPLLVSPANNAVNIDTSTLKFVWSTARGAQAYTLNIDTSAGFASPVAATYSALTDTTFTTTSLHPSTTYYWRVFGQNGVGPSTWSATYTFTTKIQTVGVVHRAHNRTIGNYAPKFNVQTVLQRKNSTPTIKSGILSVDLKGRKSVDLKKE
jgi:hypothetical protein